MSQQPQQGAPRGPPPARPATTSAIPDAAVAGAGQQPVQHHGHDPAATSAPAPEQDLIVRRQYHQQDRVIDAAKMAEMQDQAIAELSKLLQKSSLESGVSKIKMAALSSAKETLEGKLTATESVARQTATELSEMTELSKLHEERATTTEETLTAANELLDRHKKSSDDFQQQVEVLTGEKSHLLGKVEEAVETIHVLQEECVKSNQETADVQGELAITKRELLAKQRLLRPGGSWALPPFKPQPKAEGDEDFQQAHQQSLIKKKVILDDSIELGEVHYNMVVEQVDGQSAPEPVFQLFGAEATLTALLRRMYFVNSPLRLLLLPDLKDVPSGGLGGIYDTDTDVNLHLPNNKGVVAALGAGSMSPAAMSPSAASLVSANPHHQMTLLETPDPDGPLCMFVKTSVVEVKASPSSQKGEEEEKEPASPVEVEVPTSPPQQQQSGGGKKKKGGKGNKGQQQQNQPATTEQTKSPETTKAPTATTTSTTELSALKAALSANAASAGGEKVLGSTHFIFYEHQDDEAAHSLPPPMAMFHVASALLRECHHRFGRGLVHNQQSFGLALMLDAAMHSIEIQSPLLGGGELSPHGGGSSGGIGAEGITQQTGGPAEGSSVIVSVNVACRLLSGLLRGRFAVGNNPPMAASPHGYDALFTQDLPEDSASPGAENPYADPGKGVPPSVVRTTGPEPFVLFEINKFDQLLTGGTAPKKLNGLYYRSRSSVVAEGAMTRGLLLRKKPYCPWMWPYLHFSLLELPLMPASFDPGHYPDGGAPNKAFCNMGCEDLEAKFGGEKGIFHNTEIRQIAAHIEQIVESINGASFGGLKGKTVVDVGFGTGLVAEKISPLVGEKGRVYATEVSQGFIQLAMDQEKSLLLGKGNVQLVLTPGDSLAGVPSASADVVLICDVYHHFEYPLSSMIEVARILKPVTGIVIIADFERDNSLHQSHPSGSDWVMEHCRGDRSTFDHEILSLGLFSSVGDLPNAPEGGENYFSVYRRKESVAQQMPQTAGMGGAPLGFGAVVAAPLNFSPTPSKLRGLW